MTIRHLCSYSLGLLLLSVAMVANAQNMRFLKDSPISHFSDEDTNLMMRAAEDALSDQQEKASRAWSNAKTGNSGRSEVLGVFKGSTGQNCKRLRVSNRARNGIEAQATYPVCNKDGSWMIVSGTEQTDRTSK